MSPVSTPAAFVSSAEEVTMSSTTCISSRVRFASDSFAPATWLEGSFIWKVPGISRPPRVITVQFSAS